MLLKHNRRQAIQQQLSIDFKGGDQPIDFKTLNIAHRRVQTSVNPKPRVYSNYNYTSKKVEQNDSKGSITFFKRKTCTEKANRPLTTAPKVYNCSINECNEDMNEIPIYQAKRKFGILKTLPNQTDNMLIYKASMLHERISRAKKELVTLESDIEANCRFNVILKNKYIMSLKSVEEHKISNMQKRYENFKRLLDRKQIVIDEARRANAKKINNFDDISNFKRLLMKNKEVIDGSLRIWKVKTKSSYQ